MDKRIKKSKKAVPNVYERELTHVRPEPNFDNGLTETYETLDTVDSNSRMPASHDQQSTGQNDDQYINLISTKKTSLKKRLRNIVLAAILLIIVASLAVLFFLVLSTRGKGQEATQSNSNALDESSDVTGKKCKNLTKWILNGRIINFTGPNHGDTFKVECNSDHKLEGQDIVECLETNRWSEIPRCLPMQCNTLVAPKYATISPQNVSSDIGAKALITCNEGFFLQGDSEVICTSQGNWSQVPTCEKNGCDIHPGVPNGMMKVLTNHSGITTFTITCNTGYILIGVSTARCDTLGNWSELPTCKAISCGIPHIPNSRKLVTLSGTNFNDKADLKCDEGFIMAGSSVITCLSNGSWSWIEPCKEIDCGTAVISHGGIKDYTNARYGSTFSVTCDTGYSLIGSDIVQCGIDGKWTDLPLCKLHACGLPEIPANGAIDKINGTTRRKTAFIVCHPGFVMDGPNVVNCYGNGTWTRLPTCIPVSDCFDIYKSSNSSLSGIYNVTLRGSKTKLQVYCDMDTDGGGWTVFQNRFDGSVDFYQNFSEYENGFGSLNGEFWLGLKYVEEMALQGNTTLRIDLTAADGSTTYDKFGNFYLYRTDYYYLKLDGGQIINSGYYGRTIWFDRNRYFSAKDNDRTSSYNCARTCQGGWWYSYCTYANLNGRYLHPGTNITYNTRPPGFAYMSFRQYETLKASKMMFKREL